MHSQQPQPVAAPAGHVVEGARGDRERTSRPDAARWRPSHRDRAVVMKSKLKQQPNFSWHHIVTVGDMMRWVEPADVQADLQLIHHTCIKHAHTFLNDYPSSDAIFDFVQKCEKKIKQSYLPTKFSK